MRKHESNPIGRFFAACALCLIALPAWGQGSSELKGRVVDVLGAAIAKATVTIKTSEGKNQVVTDEDGEFEIQLPAGVYEIRTEEMPGFLASKYAKVRVKRGRDKRITIQVVHTLKDAECILRVTSH
jgi:uncharacterized membrane protein